MDESALRKLINCLNRQSDVLHGRDHFWTACLIIGCAFEVLFVCHEYLENRQDWHRARTCGLLSLPEKPSIKWLIFEMLGVILVLAGIGGELRVSILAGRLETRLRDANGNLVLLLEKEAGDAKESAMRAEQAAGRVKAIADAAEDKAAAAGIKTDQLSVETAPRKLTPDQQDRIGKACLVGYSFAVMKRINIESYGQDEEGSELAVQIQNALSGAKIYTSLERGAFIQTGGVDTGVLISGPPEDLVFMGCLARAFTDIGKLKNVTVNGKHYIGSLVASGAVQFSGGVQLSGGGSILPAAPLPAGSPISILVAQRPTAPSSEVKEESK